jgi:hypothetical protein
MDRRMDVIANGDNYSTLLRVILHIMRKEGQSYGAIC